MDSLFDRDGSGWNADLINEICTEDSANAIFALHRPVRDEEDGLCWCGNENEIFTVGSCYKVNCGEENQRSHICDLESSSA